MNIQNVLKKACISPDPLKDQFFLTDTVTIKKLINLAELNKNDVVLEIGAGPGDLTKETAKRAGKIRRNKHVHPWGGIGGHLRIPDKS